MPKGIVVKTGVFRVCQCGKQFEGSTHKSLATAIRLHYKTHPECNPDALEVHAGAVRQENGRNGDMLINRDAEIRIQLLLQ